MVGIAQILQIELPVTVNALALVAENADRLAHEPADMAAHHRPQIVFDRLRCLRESAEDDSLVAGDA